MSETTTKKEKRYKNNKSSAEDTHNSNMLRSFNPVRINKINSKIRELTFIADGLKRKKREKNQTKNEIKILYKQ